MKTLAIALAATLLSILPLDAQARKPDSVRVTVTLPILRDTIHDTVVVFKRDTTAAPPTVVSPGCPNEPAGSTLINDQPWDLTPIWDQHQSLGWIDDQGTGATRLAIISDPTAPYPSTNHNVIQGIFKAGDPGGSGPFNIYRPFAAAEQYKNVYICLYIKHDATWDNTNGNTGTKFLWPAGDQSHGTMTYTGFDGSRMNFQVFQQGPVDRQMAANINAMAASIATRRGSWVRIELLLKASSSNNVADGQVHVWIDGVKTHQYTDVKWQMTPARTWLSLAWGPTYGGGLHPVPRDQNQYMDHIRISGTP